MSDRSAALLSELQAVCQRILSSDSRAPAGAAALTTMASVANGTALANSLEALRRQCVDNHDQVAELKRSVDGHRGVVAGDSAANGKMLVDLHRAVEALTETVAGDRTEHHTQLGDLTRAVEALRVGLAGFSAGSRQQATELRASVEALERTVTGFGEQVQSALNTLGSQIQTALGSLTDQIVVALKASSDQVGNALQTSSNQVANALQANSEHVGGVMSLQAGAYENLVGELQAQHTRQRIEELETMLSVGLPKFSEEIHAGVQSALLEVSRTFRLAEREHGNRMVELHRDFDATARRLEAALQPRRREQSIN